METRDWDKIYQQQGQVQTEVLPKVKIAADKFKRNGCLNVLDLACGTGRHAVYLAKEGFDVYASDISEKGLAIAKQQAALANVNIKFKRHDMKTIPYQKESFDAVLCIWSIGIGTISDIRRRIGEIFRVLKYGGTLITDFISVADKTWLRGKEIENNTFAMEGLPDLVEHYSTKDELATFFTGFHQATIEEAVQDMLTVCTLSDLIDDSESTIIEIKQLEGVE